MEFIKNLGLVALGAVLCFVGYQFIGPKEGAATNYDSLIVNEDGVNEDSRFEGDTDTQLLFLDASVDSVTAGGFTWGTGCVSTTSSGIVTETVLLANSCIVVASAGTGTTQAVLSLTMPATSTMTTLIPDAGDCREWFIDTTAVVAATTTTIVAGVGHNVIGLDATGAGTGADVIDGAEYGTIRMCRETDTDVVTFVQEYIHAD